MADQAITDAITTRRVLTFTYQGHERRVVPAALGSFNGRPVLHAYQVGGGSKRAHQLPHWRNFYADQITGATVTDEAFPSDPPGFQPRSHLGAEEPYVSIAATTGSSSGGSGGSGGSGDGGSAQLNIPPEVGKVVENVMGAVGKWLKKRR